MRILIAIHGYPPTHSAGAERTAERTALWLAAHDYEIEVLAIESVSEAGFRMESTFQDGVKIHRLYYDVKDSPDVFRNLYDNPQVGDSLRSLLTAQKFDLIHLISGYMMGGQVVNIAKEFNVPVIVTLTEYWFMCARLNLIQANGALCSGPESDEKCMRCLKEDQRRFRIPSQVAPNLMEAFWSIAHHMPFALHMTSAVAERREVLSRALDGATKVLCPSHYLINKFGEFGFDTERYIFMRQGLALPDGPIPTLQPGEPGMLRLGYIGQIKFHKGIDLVVDAVIGLLNNGYQVSLDIWGSETEEPDYVGMLKERSSKYPTIRWNGRYAGAKVWDVLSTMDVLVVPSRWYENSPTVILEAYEMSMPVVATNLGGMAELVQHEKTGLVFELNDSADLQKQVERLITEEGLVERLRANLPHVKTIEEEMQELIQIYNEIV